METTIIYGLEKIVHSFIHHNDPRHTFNNWLTSWLLWEKQNETCLYVIGVDVGKGVVPIEKEQRMFRDLVGLCFQDVAKKADRVDVVWYGLHEQLK